MDLLDVLTQKSGCIFLSDLKRLVRPHRLLMGYLEFVSLSKYDTKQWTDAVNYLLDETYETLDPALARERLVHWAQGF